MLEKINETTEFLRRAGIINPDAGIILGTGLGELTANIENRIEIDKGDQDINKCKWKTWQSGSECQFHPNSYCWAYILCTYASGYRQ